MKKTRACPNCGSSIASDALDGLCPACVLAMAIESPGAPEPVAGGEPANPEFGPNMVRFFGRYELLAELGRGGMGVIYKARQIGLDRVVAVKMVLGGHFASRESLQRFQAEAQAAAKLQHPNIVALHEVGDYEGQHYFSMDYVEGRSLAELVREQPLPPARAARYVQISAEAIHYAHARGVLHRDLKPPNILIDEQDQPRITDFGLAKRLEVESQSELRVESGQSASGSASLNSQLKPLSTDLTLTGQVLGSPNYMPPEQAAGRHSDIGPRSDVYSLGAILYQLLTGRGPFLADTIEQTLSQVLHNEPVALRTLNPALPRDLETICLKCLEKDPPRRYRTAQELADELGRFLQGEPIHARPIGPFGRAWRWASRKPAHATALLLLIALGTGSTVAAVRIQRAEKRAVHRLIDSLTSQSSAIRKSSHASPRREALKLVGEALALRPDQEAQGRLRTEAIAALALSDTETVFPTNFPPSTDPMMLSIDPEFRWCTVKLRDDRLRVIQLSDGRELRKLSVTSRICDQVLGFSLGGRFLALRRGDRPIVWDVERDALLLAAEGASGLGAFSGDGSRFARSEPGGLGIYSLPQLERTPVVISNLSASVSRMDWLPDGRIVLALNDHHLALCDPRTGQLRWRQLCDGDLTALIASRDARLIAAGLKTGKLKILEGESGQVSAEFSGSGERILAMTFDRRAGILAVSDLPGSLRFFALPDGEVLMKQSLVTWQTGFSEDNSKFGPVSRGGRVGWLQWSPSDVALTLRPARAAGEPRFAEFSPDGRWLARAAESEVLIWHTQSGQLAARLPASRVTDLSFGSDASELWVSEQGGFSRWQLREPGTALQASKLSHPRERELIDEFVLTSDRRHMVATSFDVKRMRFGALDGSGRDREFGKVPGLQHDMLAISPKGDYAVTGRYADSTVRVWRVADGAMVFAVANQGCLCGVFSPDGQWLATVGNRTQLWRVGEWKLIASLDGTRTLWTDQKPAFHPSGKMLAYVSGERVIRLVTVPQANLLAELEVPGDSAAHALVFSPQGDRLAVTRDLGVTTLWDLTVLRRELKGMGLDWEEIP